MKCARRVGSRWPVRLPPWSAVRMTVACRRRAGRCAMVRRIRPSSPSTRWTARRYWREPKPSWCPTRVGERQVQEAQRVRALTEAVDQPVDKLLLGGAMVAIYLVAAVVRPDPITAAAPGVPGPVEKRELRLGGVQGSAAPAVVDHGEHTADVVAGGLVHGPARVVVHDHPVPLVARGGPTGEHAGVVGQSQSLLSQRPRVQGARPVPDHAVKGSGARSGPRRRSAAGLSPSTEIATTTWRTGRELAAWSTP